MWLPKRPDSLEEANVEYFYVEGCILKLLNAKGSTRGSSFADLLKLPYGLIDPILKEMRDKDIIASNGGSGIGGAAGLDFILTPKGNDVANVARERNPYYGATPVEPSLYTEAVKAQRFQSNLVRRQHLDKAFNDIMISQEYLNQLGPAINSGGPIFLYGKPGNGKTTMSERIARLFKQGIFVPYAIWADGEVVQVFDEKLHVRVPMDALPENHPAKSDPKGNDPRWVYCFRPFIVVGGELTLEMLDLQFREGQLAYEAPFQMKANGGVLLIDDFGRQKVKPTEFLNRWIYPLEKQMDFLTLVSGKKIEVPFEQMIILSTNLDPRDLGDEAFWRRIRYMIETPSPSDVEFKAIFQVVCKKKGIEFDEDSYTYMVEKYYKRTNKEFRSVHPRDILNRVSDNIAYFTLPSKLSRPLVDAACRTLFGGITAAVNADPVRAKAG